MPPLPTIPNVLKTQLEWIDSNDSSVTSTMFWRYTGSPPNASACANLATALANAFLPLNDLWTETTSLIGVKATDLSDTSGGVGTVTVSQVGDLIGPDVAGGTCVCVSYLINRRYRGGKPRNYFPFGNSSSLNGRQAWGPTFIGNVASGIATAISTFIGTTESGTTIASHANVSYYDGFTVVTNPITGRARNVPKLRTVPEVDDIVGRNVLGRPASQRRRNRT